MTRKSSVAQASNVKVAAIEAEEQMYANGDPFESPPPHFPSPPESHRGPAYSEHVDERGEVRENELEGIA